MVTGEMVSKVEWLSGEWLARGLSGARMRPRRAAAAGGPPQAYARKLALLCVGAAAECL